MRVIMTGGGTGGHIYPAIAIANEIKRRDAEAEILFVGTKRGLEKDLVPKSGYPIKFITVSGFNRKNLLKNVKTVGDLAKGNLESHKIIKEFAPDVIIGTGGYVCGPVVRAGKKMGIKAFIHEQNAFPGVTNKLLEKYADNIFTSFEAAAKHFKKKDKLVLVGNPVRREFYTVEKDASREKLEISKDDFLVLTFGGSQGARRINETVKEIIPRLSKEKNIKIIFATGKMYYKEIKAEVESDNSGIYENVKVLEYIDDMATYLSAADVIISRAGALAVSEITVCGKATILIPSPNVTGNHQFYNAKSVADHGGAFLIEEKDLSPEIVCDKIISLRNNPDVRVKMERESRACAPEGAAEKIVDYVLSKLQNK